MGDRPGTDFAQDVTVIDELTGTRLSVDSGGAGLSAPRAEESAGFIPDPDSGPTPASADGSVRLTINSDGALQSRSAVLSDEGAFRDDFGGSALILTSTGTAVFTTGSNEVTGTGFLTEGLNKEWFIKAAVHADTALTPVLRVESDTLLYLTEPYPGASAVSATYSKSKWSQTIGGGGTITVASSAVSIANTGTTGHYAEIHRVSDYLPIRGVFRARVSARNANQETILGFSQGDINTGAAAFVSLTGTSNTTITLKTASSSDVAEREVTSVLLPDNTTTATYHTYRIEVSADSVHLHVDDILVVAHKAHIPGPYDALYITAGIQNTGASSAATLDMDVAYVSNFNLVNTEVVGTVDSSVVQNVAASTVNNTVATVASPTGTAQHNNIAAGATWTGTAESTLGIAYIQFSFKSDQTCAIYIDQSTNGSDWDTSYRKTIPAGAGIAHSHAAEAAYYRMRVTNVGGVATTYIRLGTYLCPIANESEPIIAAMEMSSHFPVPNSRSTGEIRPLQMGPRGKLEVRALIGTDEGSFNERFPGSSLQSNLSGTVAFKNGLTALTNTGTSFASTLYGQYLRLSTDTDDKLTQVFSVESDAALTLVSGGYLGTTGSGTAVSSNWFQAIAGTATIGVSAGACTLSTANTTNGNTASIFRLIDYPNLMLQARATVSQRIANQTAIVGMRDTISTPTTLAQFQFTGTVNTVVDCVSTASTGETTTTTVTIPAAGTSAAYQLYEIRFTQDKIAFYINRALVTTHTAAAPGAYTKFGAYVSMANGTGAASATSLVLDSVLVNNQSIVDAVVYQSDPSKMNVTPNVVGRTTLPTATGVDTPIAAMGDRFGRQVVQLGSIRELRGIANITLTSDVTETTLIAAGGTGVYNDLLMLVVSNTSNNTNTRIDFRDTTGGAIIFSLQSPGNSTTGFSIPGTSIPQAATNTVWTAQCATSTNSIRIFAVYEKNQ